MNSSIFGGLLRRPEAGALIGLIGVITFFAIVGGIEFLYPSSVGSWLSRAAALGIVAIPVGLLMIAGELDISVGATITSGALITALVSGYYEMPIVVGMLASLGFGAVVGLLNGFLVVRTGVPSFIVTLGTLFAVSGLLLGATVVLTGTTSIALTAPEIIKSTFGAYFGGFQVLVLWWIGITAAFVFFVHLSPFGNWIFAMGGDKVSARNAGIPTDRMTILLFVLSSVCASFVGMSQAILFQSVQATPQLTLIFNTIIAVVVGGVLLTGGFGSVIGIFFGTITFAVVTQGIYYTSFDQTWSNMVIGILLLGAVLMNNTFRKMALSYAPKKGGK
ncbi:ABC transporter permease [Neotabrizicola shimadae]|uniref:Xylose transport system permease protein XylH n=1 Tax=Neotabrizicola shimadae TaxID=2807096 RepID=A0A8G0ZX25_9RHOB|nr:ABC transporter permease [Neotabrizicola shimadae]QYZ72109.1 ABC transporter permease [Neotabrizicola shimadae]